MRLLDLFSGIGGFSIGLERAGFKTVAFCEIDPYCRRVLAKHWPHVPCYGDIRTLTAAQLAADGIIAPMANANVEPIKLATGTGGTQRGGENGQPGVLTRYSGLDAICGGFPCQDISVAGKGAGIGGERSGLWSEYRRLVGELRPRIVIVENVTALLGRGLSTVLGDLAALGYDAEWHCISAAAVGAPHRRDRIWIVAYPEHDELDASAIRRGIRQGADNRRVFKSQGLDTPPELVANTSDEQFDGRELWGARWSEFTNDSQWRVEPDVGRVAHGVPARVHRLRALGNAVVPQIPELIGRAIMQETLVNRA